MTPATGATGKERPILVSGPMALAAYQKRKLMTRRIIKPQPVHAQIHEWKGKLIYEGENREWCWKDQILENIWDFPRNRKPMVDACPYGKPGDRLWVRESWMWYGRVRNDAREGGFQYRADASTRLFTELPEPSDRWEEFIKAFDAGKCNKWKPGIHMFRWASRTLLEITQVRAERLNDISEADAIAEGIEPSIDEPGMYLNYSGCQLEPAWVAPLYSFETLWESINGGGSWDRNDWVWAISFRKVNS